MAIFGDTSTTNTYDASYASGNGFAIKYTLSEDADVASCSFYAKYATAQQSFRLAIYADAGAGLLGDLVFVTEEFTVTSAMSSYGWRTANKYGGGTTRLVAGDYWIWLWPGGTSSGAHVNLIAWDGATSVYKDGVTYHATDSPPSPMTGESSDTVTYAALYATYTTAPAGIAIPLLNHLLLGD